MNNQQKIRIFVIPAVLLLVLVYSYGQLAAKQKPRKGFSIGERFHQETSLTWRGVIGNLFLTKPKKPPQYKTYPGAKLVKLPKPKYQGITVEEAIEKRRSVRNYSTRPISLLELSQLLFAAQGVTGRMYGEPLRSTPSAGALYPIEIYVVVNNVQGLSQGIYHYAIRNHELELIKSGDFSAKITDAGLEQEMLGEADVTFILSAIFDRIRHKYGERGFRYVYMEAGHISQNIYLQAVSLGLGSVSVGAFIDEKVNQLISIDGYKEAAIYLHAVGTL
ncbi:MAG: SagB/ThcOx family dehydrogenase [Candidatus Marinimicrobia bacterium]|nr:SagB/ThcOx family dehydrogenase [Candidatus Neomarinimicrobiota bacterium]